MLTSYAQALEDIVLHRALGEIDGGFYIDVGANDPVIDSVTKLYYELGWRGINVEPSPFWFAKVQADRPRDINLNLAMSDAPGVFTFHEIEGSGLSTLVEDVASRHESNGMARRSYDIATDTLASICAKHAPETIHFLKVDVEGAEEKVLLGADFGKHRPWIVLVEATEPLSSAPSHLGWDHLLTSAGYEFVLFDGLNRYYIAEERQELKPRFAVPGDRYETISAVWTLGHWRRIADEREVEIAQLRAELNSAQTELAEIKASRWWKARVRSYELRRKLGLA